MLRSALTRRGVPEAKIVGRAAEREQLRMLVERGGPVALVGLPGAGATALAADLAREHEDVVWFDAEAATRADDIAQALAEAAHAGLVILDGVPPQSQLLAAARQESRPVVITSTGGAADIALGSLPMPEALHLLRSKMGEREAEFTDEELASLVAATGRLPAALVDLAGMLQRHQHWTSADYLEAWRVRAPISDALRDAFDRHCAQLWADDRLSFALLASCPGATWDEKQLDQLWARPAAPVAARLEGCLLLVRGEGWRLADGVSPYAQDCLSRVAPTTIRQARERLAEHCADRLDDLRRHPGDTAARQWLDRERDVLVALAADIADDANHRLIIRFGRLLSPHLRCHPDHAKQIARAARDSAEAVGDPRVAAAAELDLASAHYACGEFHAALRNSERALAWAQQAEDHATQEAAHNTLWQCCVVLGDYRAAVVQLRRAVERKRRSADEAGLVSALIALAGAYLRIGADKDACDASREAAEVAKREGLPASVVSALTIRIRAQLRHSKIDEAARDLRLAQAAARRAGDDVSKIAVDVLHARQVALLRGMDQAEPLFAAAAHEMRTVRTPWLIAQLELVWGEAHLYAGNRDEARTHFQRVLDLMGPTGADFLVRVAETGLAGCDGEPIEWDGSEIAVARQPPPTSVLDVLSARERTVADLAADGYSNQQIATRLSISARTVEDHIRRICTKLAIPSRAAIGRKIADIQTLSP